MRLFFLLGDFAFFCVLFKVLDFRGCLKIVLLLFPKSIVSVGVFLAGFRFSSPIEGIVVSGPHLHSFPGYWISSLALFFVLIDRWLDGVGFSYRDYELNCEFFVTGPRLYVNKPLE